jgi:hypothetical protein
LEDHTLATGERAGPIEKGVFKMSVQLGEKVPFTPMLCFLASMLMTVGLILCAWQMSWAEVYTIHNKNKKLIYSNAPVISSKAPKTGEDSRTSQSSIEPKERQGGSETQQGTVQMQQKTESEQKNIERQGSANSSALPEEGGI